MLKTPTKIEDKLGLVGIYRTITRTKECKKKDKLQYAYLGSMEKDLMYNQYMYKKL